MSRRVDLAEAEAVMHSIGLTPQMPYPGMLTPWPSTCDVCGKTVTPTFANVKAGRTRGCRFCAGRGRIDPESAVLEAQQAGYAPLEPFPGRGDQPWRCTHVACGLEAVVKLNKIRAGEGCCKPCGVKKSSVTRSVDTELAQEVMIKALLEPLVPYPGQNHAPWKCRCLTCGAVVHPTRGNVWRGQGGCLPCGRERNALARLGDAGQAEADMLAALLRPLESYPGSNNPWRCECLRCGEVVSPRLGHIRRGRGGCLWCGFASTAAKQMGDPVRAAADMEAADYSPLEQYPGAARPWRCLHRPCGNEVTARLNKIRQGEGCCAHCATYGFNLSAPAVVYVLQQPDYDVVKVGITAASSDRVDRFRRKGFTVVGVLKFATGRQARNVEQTVLRHIRAELGLTHALTEADTGSIGGWTESFSASELSPETLWALVRRFAETDDVPDAEPLEQGS